jgi:hypothetical protein
VPTKTPSVPFVVWLVMRKSQSSPSAEGMGKMLGRSAADGADDACEIGRPSSMSSDVASERSEYVEVVARSRAEPQRRASSAPEAMGISCSDRRSAR